MYSNQHNKLYKTESKESSEKLNFNVLFEK